jgi:hypothetical protein
MAAAAAAAVVVGSGNGGVRDGRPLRMWHGMWSQATSIKHAFSTVADSVDKTSGAGDLQKHLFFKEKSDQKVPTCLI